MFLCLQADQNIPVRGDEKFLVPELQMKMFLLTAFLAQEI